MLTIKSELGNPDDGLNEDQIAAAELVAAAAEVEAASGGSRSGTPVGATLTTQSGGQRIIQVIQRSGNFSGNATPSRMGQMRPLQQVQLGSGSLGPTSVFNTNTALQYPGGLSSISSISGPTLIKSSPGVDFGSSKVLPPGASILTSNMSTSSSMFGSASQPSQFGMGLGGVSIASSNVAAAAAAASAATAATQGGPNGSTGSQSRKPCNCNKSHCLKLYCDCFAQGQLCQNCNCTNCMNNLQYEEERARAIKMTLDRNPMAFHPKIGRGEGERKHTKGCNCKKSGCLKNYCECYEAKISCTELCRCQGCKNTEDGMERRSLMRLSMMNQAMKSRQQVHSRKSFIGPAPETANGVADEPGRPGDGFGSPWSSRSSSGVFWDRGPSAGGVIGSTASAFHRYSGFYANESMGDTANTAMLPPAASLAASNSYGVGDMTAQQQEEQRNRAFDAGQLTSAPSHAFCDPYHDNDAATSGTSDDALPHTFITWEVAEACCGCMLAQADDAERRDMLPAAQERIILEEFGRCLGQIVESASKAQPLPSYAPGATVTLQSSGHVSSAINLHRMPPGAMGDLEVSHGRLQHGGMSGGDENVIVDV